MRCLKGVIQDEFRGLILIKLVTSGMRFWITPTPTSRIQRSVLVAWDYVRNEPHEIYTEDDWNILIGRKEPEVGVFSIPVFKEVEDDVNIEIHEEDYLIEPIDFWWIEEGSEVGDGVDGVFSNPFDDGTETGVVEDHHNYLFTAQHP